MKKRIVIGLLISFINFIVIFGLPSQFMTYDVSQEFMICVAAALVVMIWAQIESRHHLFFYQTVWIYFILFGYLIQTGLGVSYISGTVTQVSMTFVGIYLVHLITLVAASLYLAPVITATERNPVQNESRRISLMICAGFLVPVMLGFFVGWNILLSSRQEFHANENVSSTTYFLVLIAKTIPFVLLASIAENTRERGGLIPKITFAILLLIAMTFSNPGNTARFLSLSSLVLVALFMVSASKREQIMANIALAFPAVGLILLPLTSMLRNGFSSVEQALTLDFFGSLEFSALQAMLDGIDMAAQLSGAQIISGLLILVPRALLPWKSEGLGPEIADSSGYVFSNVAVPPIFAAYVDGGLVGVFIFSIFVAWIFGKYKLVNGRNFHWRRRKNFYSAVIFCSLPMLARGDFTTYMLSIYAFAISYEVLRPFGRMVLFRSSSYQGR